MGQQPNIQIDHEDRFPPAVPPAAARSWFPHRPGDVEKPGDIPWGGGFGTQGPDAGYALTLVAGRDLPLGAGEHRKDAAAAVAALMMARASHFGRAPVVGDAEVAEALLGYRPGTPAPDRRSRLIEGLAHTPSRAVALLDDVDLEALTGPRDEALARFGAA